MTVGDTYGVVVPVKAPAVAKSRLGALGDSARRRLAEAFAMDTVEAAAHASGVTVVLVVTDDRRLARRLAELDALTMPDGDRADLNASLVLAAAELVRRHPGVRPVALCADLPALRPTELSRVLERSSVDAMSFVTDAAGTGTTLVSAPDLARFRPAFGRGSRATHIALGGCEIDVDVPGLRQDVDTPADLRAAIALGLGRRTTLVAADVL